MPATASPSWRASASGLPQTRTGSRRRLVTSVFTSMGRVNDGTMRKPLWLIWLYRLFLFFKNHDFSVTGLARIRKHSYGGVSFQGCLRLAAQRRVPYSISSWATGRFVEYGRLLYAYRSIRTVLGQEIPRNRRLICSRSWWFLLVWWFPSGGRKSHA